MKSFYLKDKFINSNGHTKGRSPIIGVYREERGADKQVFECKPFDTKPKLPFFAPLSL